jgi:hypothetical protein
MAKVAKYSGQRKGRTCPQSTPLLDLPERVRLRARWLARTHGTTPAIALLIAETAFNCGGDK